ncbi:MAG TPA: hypothetical protein VJR29_11275 [bacterium]|nr:hypothetical protein [bacterium]
MRKHKSGFKLGFGALAASLLLGASAPGLAQTFDAPVDFLLPSLGFLDDESIDIPSTLNIGNFDTSILGPGDSTLNEVAIAAVGFIDLDSSITQRYWTIVHDSAADTRSLALSPPSDIETTLAETNYFFPSSLQLVDLNGDQADDIALLGVTPEMDMAVNAPANVKFFASGFGPARAIGVPSQAGPNFFATSLNELGSQTDGSILTAFGEFDPNFAAADFDGDGLVDLAFYDFDGADQIAVSLQNNGSLGALPRTDSVLTLPAGLAGFDSAVNLVAADIDGDGPVDLALTLSLPPTGTGTNNFLLVFKGNGDGSFVSDPIASVSFPDQSIPVTLAAGNFDGDDFLDFAVFFFDQELSVGDLSVVLCAPGGSCAVNPLGLPQTGLLAIFGLAAADFDGDGLDDLANTFIQAEEASPEFPQGGVQVRLNPGDGNFPVAADQTLAVGGSLDNRVTIPIATKDIDGCGGPDLAYSAFELIPEPTPQAVTGQGFGEQAVYHASVAFNHNDDPVADAGTPVAANGGFQVGGDPTCLGELGENLSIEWEVVSGNAEISDSSAANPIVQASQTSVLQVTCTDACGAASSATVTVQGGGFLLNGTGCSLGGSAAGGSLWLLILGGLPFGVIRLKSRSKGL